MTRDEYLLRSREFQSRGTQLPHAKLTDDDVEAIRSAVRQREALRDHIRNNLSNDALAKPCGVHVRTVEKVVQGYTWVHVE